MVKPDVKHNYYADLDLPTTASIDDIRKAYRKLALQYHPDRNAGKEAECVPRFQAIQAANEVLSDPTVKAKYDQDRRKAGLYPGAFKASAAPTTGNPYQASSAFPPPPRRTQPGTWQRPASAAYGASQTGADRFTNFPKASGSTPRKDPAADRTQQFRAWQSMNSGAERPRYGAAQPPPPPPRSPNPPTNPPNTARPRPQRQDTKMPSEEQIRAGMRHGKSAAAGAGAEGPAAEKQSAWQAFQSANAAKQGMPRKQRTGPSTPKRAGGFDPNAPGSDERPAPMSTGHYSHRHRSEDFGGDGNVPPPPPGPPPGASPTSPTFQNAQRPFANPLRPFPKDDVPYAEGNRKSTPYSSFIGEKTQFNSDGLRRSASTRDTTRLNPQATSPGNFRARSSSPPIGRQSQPNGKKSFVPGGSSESSEANSSEVTEDSSDMDRDFTETPEQYDSNTDNNARPKAGPPRNSSFPPPKNRPIKKPTLRRPNGSNLSSNSSSSQPLNGSNIGAQSDGDQPSMEQRKSSTNMYGTPFSSTNTPSFSRGEWVANAFGSLKSSGQKSTASIPKWAFPNSVLPGARPQRRRTVVAASQETSPVYDGHVVNKDKDPLWNFVSAEMREAYWLFRAKLHSDLRSRGDNVEQLNQLDLDIFMKLVSSISSGQPTGLSACDAALHDILIQFPSIRSEHDPRQLADKSSAHSFSIPISNDTFIHTTGKSRSVEDINTNFTPEGWTPNFQGTPDYFAAAGRRPSPGRRTPSNRSGRPATMDIPSSGSGTMPPPPPRSEGQSKSAFTSPSDTQFNPEAWKTQFSDASWTQASAAANGGTASKPPSRQNTAAQTSTNEAGTAGTKEQPHIIIDDESVEAAPQPRVPSGAVDDADAMDIDTPPPHSAPANTSEADKASKEPRLYSVPPSAWRKQQEQQQAQGHQKSYSDSRAPSGSKLKTNLDDLSHVEPIGKVANGLKNLADMSSTLPFESQAASAITSHAKEPTKLAMPPIPKAPEPPAKLTKASWHIYALSFGTYLQAFHGYNKTVLAHFDARQKQSEARLQRGTQWLEASGDTSEQLGFDSYIKGVREDEQVREAWNIGSEKHLEAVQRFDEIRERVKKLAGAGVLQDA